MDMITVPFSECFGLKQLKHRGEIKRYRRFLRLKASSCNFILSTLSIGPLMLQQASVKEQQ